MSLLDLITGGKSSQATADMNAAIDALKAVGVPDPSQLSLPELQKYVSAGVLTPQQMQAFTVGSNALDQTSAANEGLTSELGVLGGLQDIVDQGGQDAAERADIQKVLNDLGTTERGANLAAVDQMAQRGVSGSGLTLASLLSGEQAGASNANQEALGAAANAENRQIAALEGVANIGKDVQGQEYGADLNKANAANAIAQFNAGQNQGASQFNASERARTNEENLSNAQAISNANTQTEQTVQSSKPAAVQQAFNDALQRATGISGAYTNKATNDTTQGQQYAGTIGSLISGAGQIAAGGLKPPTATPQPATANMAHGGEVCMDEGGRVPGTPAHPGVDTKADDHVPAMLSPHEIVIPKTIAERRDPAEIMAFVRSLPKPDKPSVHPKAVLDTLRALNLHHQGA